jgi:hypothetical protein
MIRRTRVGKAASFAQLAIFVAILCVATGAGTKEAFRALGASGSSSEKAASQQPSPAKTAALAPAEALERRLGSEVKPFFERHCFACHGPKKQKASLDLSHDLNLASITNNSRQWELVLERLQAREMPPEDAPSYPDAAERAAVIAAIRHIRDQEAERYAGDPGNVLARRLSNAEFDYTIRDLTGVDIRPTRDFPVDPANQAGFDNSGESLAMSATLLKKYLGAARLVADHMVLKPDGFVFAPHPVVTETDRDKYCVKRIIDFYQRHQVDYADYFLAAYAFRERDKLGRANVPLSDFATEAGLSPRYLALIWSILTGDKSESGPLAAVRKMWNDLPTLPIRAVGSQTTSTVPRTKVTTARAGCERLRDLVLSLRRQLKPNIERLQAPKVSPGSQPLVLWRNRQFASHHAKYRGAVVPDLAKLAEQLQRIDADLVKLLPTEPADKDAEERLRPSLDRFCSVFADAFVVSDRGPYFNPNEAGKGRLLTAGFHLMQGYFRDDQPLCEWILNERERHELDSLWRELDFITLAPMRQYRDFIFFERAEPPRFMFEAEFDFARSEDKDATSEIKMARLAKAYLTKAKQSGAGEQALQAMENYFTEMSATIRQVERDRLAAEPSHMEALVKFAHRAYRRPLKTAERDDLLAFYRKLRTQEDLGHEEAMGDALVSVLMSPHFCYRVDLSAVPTSQVLPESKTQSGPLKIEPLSDYALASRLSYFLWSSMPDAELLEHAAAGDLHHPTVLITQTRRLLTDPRVRGLATEFGGNWLDFRRFEEHNAVDRERFPSFTNDLRQAMFEEPIRYFLDMARRNRSVLDLLYGKDTFVNALLAKHYGMPFPAKSQDSNENETVSGPARSVKTVGDQDKWVHIEDAQPFHRGGLLPMSVFLTQNAPGLRTSPVKRGYWVVRRLLGEQIPPPPPTVPELPKDEAKLGQLTLAQLLARHRDDKSCAGCHRRFDAIGLVFENFGPIGERRTKDLGGRPLETGAIFPDGKDRNGLEGLQAYLHEKRQDDFVDNLCKKLFSYALGRSLLISDKKALEAMKTKMQADNYAFGSLVEAIVLSPQFLNKRGEKRAEQVE